MTEKGFDFPRLINDDFFESIKILLRERRFISALKLLLSFIDTMGFLEFEESETKNVFCEWLEAHVNLQAVGVSSLELWEYRNGLLHMSNLNSRKVNKGEVKPLIACVGLQDSDILPNPENEKLFRLEVLVHEVIEGIEHCIQCLSENSEFLPSFLERYDLVVSDHRVVSMRKS
jgi:hypothetical protein